MTGLAIRRAGSFRPRGHRSLDGPPARSAGQRTPRFLGRGGSPPARACPDRGRQAAEAFRRPCLEDLLLQLPAPGARCDGPTSATRRQDTRNALFLRATPDAAGMRHENRQNFCNPEDMPVLRRDLSNPRRPERRDRAQAGCRPGSAALQRRADAGWGADDALAAEERGRLVGELGQPGR